MEQGKQFVTVEIPDGKEAKWNKQGLLQLVDRGQTEDVKPKDITERVKTLYDAQKELESRADKGDDKAKRMIEEYNAVDTSKASIDLADFIKMNRAFFADPMQAMKLVTQLRQFQAKVENDIANSDDKRGNARLLKAQTVEHNLPEHFTLNIPIFRNTEPQTIDVEVDVKSTDLTMTLVSPEAADIVHKSTKDIIQDELKKIGETCPDLVIIEQ